MKKWMAQSIWMENDFQCKNCGEARYGFFIWLRHYKGFRDLDGVCFKCINDDFREVKKECEFLVDLYWLWHKYKDYGTLFLNDFNNDLIDYLIKQCKAYDGWKPEYEGCFKKDSISSLLAGDIDVNYVIEKFFIRHIKFLRSLGEWN